MTIIVEAPAGWSDFASTIATSAAAFVALVIAVWTIRQRRKDDMRRDAEAEARSLAQAQLVITIDGNPGFNIKGEGGPNTEACDFPFANHSDRALLHVIAEAWLTDGYRASSRQPVLAAGETTTLRVNFPEGGTSDRYAGWRVRWMDADGKMWCRDAYPQEVPERLDPTKVMDPSGSRRRWGQRGSVLSTGHGGRFDAARAPAR